APLVIDVAVEPDSSHTGHPIVALNDVRESAFKRAVDVFREIHFPPQPVIHGQLLGCAPSVLPVVKHSMLALRRVRTGAYVAAKVAYITKQEGREIQTTFARVARDSAAERVHAGAIGITRY